HFKLADSPWDQLPFAMLVEADNHRFGHGNADLDGDAGAGRDLQFAGPGAHGRGGTEQGGARHLTAAGEDQDAALALRVALRQPGQREMLERGPRQRLVAHRVPAMASGAAVLAAPSAS